MTLTLYVDGYFVSSFDATCFVALTEKKLPFTFARALLRDGQGLPPALAAKTAIQRIPAMQHDGFVLTESIAIASYLEDAFPEPPVFPLDPRAKARALQIMAWSRIDLRELRHERPWFTTVYPVALAPLSRAAAAEAAELVEVTSRLLAAGDLDTWNIAHADLAFVLARLRPDDHPLPDRVRAFKEAVYTRPSVRAYIDHPRPPNAPP